MAKRDVEHRRSLREHSGIVLDTNLLLLLWGGRWSTRAIEQHKCTNQFDETDYWQLESLVQKFRKVAVTTSILTESCNLIRQHRHRETVTSSVAKEIPLLHEHHIPGVEVVQDSSFIPLGLTDAGILMLARKNWFVLTTDMALFLRLSSEELLVQNFNHVRSLDER